ncbi:MULTISPECIES: hypothetical protein [Leifsonia]|uniref:Sensor domain-containing protein n=5 Tax=Bacteria TaxID=2 RepID=A0A7W4YKT0_LEIAQ|nr:MULTISPECIES: hypothetical protein [Leifsonia]MBB2969486.1 hypothetical protein [Leifsonia aquatica]MBO1741507.1 hypothetical protein [Leifsonia sp. TF02-11]MCI0159491.1 hypothetical protein [Leifsonia shinshuensis]MDN4599514.1 hypothetical protein [Leifsonia virtsii]QNE38017.1 hypothetical protein F1C12_22320 [Leifsonia shinshuensis]
MAGGRLTATTSAAALIFVVALTGCSSGPSQAHANVRAQLNPATAQILLPLESYAMSWGEVQTVNHANSIAIEKCMANKGLTFPRASQDWSALAPLPDRRYGLWAPADAEANGYELPESSQSKDVQAQEDALGPDWWQDYRACFKSTKQLPVMGVNTSPDQSVVDRGMNESFEALLASDEFKSVREKWLSCIQDGGLAANKDARVLVPQFPSAGEEQLEVAAIDVRCKESLNSVQTLADWEATKQAGYIDDHEGELTAYRDKVKKVVAQAQKLVTTVGG